MSGDQLPLDDAWLRLDGLCRAMQELSERHYALRQWIPWKADTQQNFGEDWPVGTVMSTGADDAGDWIVATDNVRASEHNGATAKDDAEAIAAMHNVWPQIVEALRAVLNARGQA